MLRMFNVRPRLTCARSLRGPPPAHHLRRLHPHARPVSSSSPRPNSCALLSTRQGASVFNQPLSIDTSSVTDMNAMFFVRPRVPCAQSPVGPSLQNGCPTARAASPYPPRASPHSTSRLPARTSSRIAYPLLSTRQEALAFDQPLNFDTSSVTAMWSMFRVRSSPCPAPNLQPRPPLHAACSTVVHRLLSPDPYTSRPAPHALLSTLGRARRRSTSC